MTTELIINVIGICVALTGIVIATAIAAASMNDEARARLSGWTKAAASRTYGLLRGAFIAIAIGNGALGVAIFWLESTPPTRKDILILIVFLLNIGMGIWQLVEAADRKAKS